MGRERREQVSLDHTVEALFLLIYSRALHNGQQQRGGVRGVTTVGRVVRTLQVQGIRKFNAQRARLTASRLFRLTFVKFFNDNLQEWAEEVTRRGLLLQQGPGSSSLGQSKVGPIPLAPFNRSYTWILAVPIQLVHAAGSHSCIGGEGGREGAGGGRSGTGGVGG